MTRIYSRMCKLYGMNVNYWDIDMAVNCLFLLTPREFCSCPLPRWDKHGKQGLQWPFSIPGNQTGAILFKTSWFQEIYSEWVTQAMNFRPNWDQKRYSKHKNSKNNFFQRVRERKRINSDSYLQRKSSHKGNYHTAWEVSHQLAEGGGPGIQCYRARFPCDRDANVWHRICKSG